MNNKTEVNLKIKQERRILKWLQ